MNPIRIECEGSDISSSVNWRDVHLVTVLTKEVSTLSFSVLKGVGQTYPVVTVPAIGDEIEMYDSTGVVFGGTVTQVEATISGLLIQHMVTCTDHSYIFDGELVKKNYSNEDPQDIVIDLVETFCAGKGFTTNHVQRGNFVIPSVRFSYQAPTKCLESLARLIGWDWYIDASKDVHFFLGNVSEGVIGDGGAAPISIDQTGGESGSDIDWNSLDVGVNLQNMQNSCYVIGGNYTKTFSASNTPDTYKTDGTTQVWSLAYPYTVASISVTLDAVAQTVGTDGVTDPASVQVLYNDKNRNIKFTAGAPTTNKVIKIFGNALLPIIAHASDATSVATYGEYQSVIVDSKIVSVPEAQARATASILQFGQPVYEIRLNTLVPGCAIGQAIYVNLPAFGLTTWLVIKRIEGRVYAPGTSGKLQYSLYCVGNDNVTMVDLMTMLLQQEATQTMVEDSTVNQNLELTPLEELSLDEAVTVSGAAHVAMKWGASANNSKWGFSSWQ